MNEQYINRKESELKAIANSSIKTSTKENKYSENIATEDKLNGILNTKQKNSEDENFKTKSTQISYNPFKNNPTYKNSNRNIGDNSSPKNNKTKDLFSRIDNSPIKNMDLSPFKNLNYSKNSENSNPFGGISNIKMDLSDKLDNLTKNSGMNKSIFQQGNDDWKVNYSSNKGFNASPKFYDENSNKEKNKNLDINNNNKLMINKEIENIKAENNAKNRVFPDIKNGIFLNNHIPNNNQNNLNNNFLNTLSRNFESSNNTNSLNPNNSYAPYINLYKNPNLENNCIGQIPNSNFGLMNNCSNNFNSQMSFSNFPNANSIGIIKPFEVNSNNNPLNNKLTNLTNGLCFDPNLGFNAIPPQQFQQYYKGNISIYGKDAEIDIKKNPFEKEKNVKENAVNPFKRSIAREQLDKYERENEIFINNQLNYRGVPVMPNASAKPSLSLVEARNRLGIFSKTFEEDKFFGILNQNDTADQNPFAKKNIIDENAFANLKSKHNKKNPNGKNAQDSKENEANSPNSENYNAKEECYLNPNKKSDLALNLLNVSNSSDDAEFLKKLKKMQEVDYCYEMIEEFDNEEESRIENPSCCVTTKKDFYLNTSITETTSKMDNAKLLNSNESKTKSSNDVINKNAVQRDSEGEMNKRRKLPEDVNINELVQKYPELFILCRINDTENKNAKPDFDFEKFKRLVEEEMNLLVPPNKKNDEVFKRKVIAKKIWSEKFSENQSAKRSDTYFSNQPQEKLDIELHYYTIKKKRMSHSAKKFYSSVLELVDPKKNITKHFTMFRDCDMGITEYWQVSMIESKEDEDVETDEESCKRANAFCLLEIREAIAFYNHQKRENRDDLFENKRYITLPNGKLKYPEFK